MLLEITYQEVSVIYRSPSQSIIEFDSFLSNFEKLVSDVNNRKLALSIITGDFNARSQSWWSNDINTTGGSKLLALSSSSGFSQLIDEPTHIKTNKPGLSVDSGVHSSLHSNCHHQIIYSNFNLNICYPPPNQRLVWDYKKIDPNSIRKALDLVNWERLFDQKSIDAQVATFNDTVLNIFRNFVPNKYMTIEDKDPVWMNETIKSKLKAKTMLYKKHIQSGRFENDVIFLENLITELNNLISSTKASYYENLGKKLNNPLLPAKTYWSILKTFYNDKKFH